MVQQERINLKSWSTKQLREWVETACLLPDSITIHIFDTCIQAVEELNIRENVYEELKMLY